MSPAKGQATTAKGRAALDANRHLGPPAARAKREAERESEDAVLDTEAERLNAEVEQRGPGALTPPVIQFNREIAQARWLREREANSWLRRYPTSATAQATRRVEQSIKLTKLIGDLLEAREAAIQLGLREAALPNRGQPVQPRRNPEHVLKTCVMLIKQGAIPGLSPGTLAVAREFAEALEADLRDRKAAMEEVAGLVRAEGQ